MRDESGTPFYYLDGPLQGKRIRGNFHPDKVGNLIYNKSTYGFIAIVDDKEFRFICDVAHIGELPEHPPILALTNLIIDGPNELVVDPKQILKYMEILDPGLAPKYVIL